MALIVDYIVLIPLMLLGYFLNSASGYAPYTIFIVNVLVGVISAFYYILMHTFYGQTLGKMLMKVKVLDVKEYKVTFAQAFFRSLPQLIPVFVIIGFAHPQFLAGNVSEFEKFLGDFVKVVSSTLLPVWHLADVIVALSTDKHRALHDFIAGTVVIKTNV